MEGALLSCFSESFLFARKARGEISACGYCTNQTTQRLTTVSAVSTRRQKGGELDQYRLPVEPSVGLQNCEGDLYQRQSRIMAGQKQVMREFAKLCLVREHVEKLGKETHGAL